MPDDKTISFSRQKYVKKYKQKITNDFHSRNIIKQVKLSTKNWAIDFQIERIFLVPAN